MERDATGSSGCRTIKTGYRHNFACLSVLITVFSSAVSAQILINEIDADTPRTDVAEFVELFDGGSGETDLSAYVLVFFNGNKDTVYRAFDLDGSMTNKKGYFVLCGNEENVNNCDKKVSPDTNLIQNGADAIALYRDDETNFPKGTTLTTTNLIDAIVYDTNDRDDDGLLALLGQREPQVNEGNPNKAAIHSNQRCPNGSGSARRTADYAQFPPTPGAENTCGITTKGTIPNVSLNSGEIYNLDVSRYFNSSENTLTYTVISSNPDVATVHVSGGTITITPK